jgi:hypothetical protein
MVARLKLKGIDGRAPPGVEPAALLKTNWAVKVNAIKKVFASPRILKRATPSNCGNTLKLLTTKHKWKRLCGWGIMTSGTVITLKDD